MATIQNLRPWKPGQSGNPKGRPRLTPELRAIKALTADELCRLISKYGRMSKSEIQIAAGNQDIPMVELAIASIFVSCAKHGDYLRLAFLMDRSIGKPPESFESEDDEYLNRMESMSEMELVELAKKKIAELEATA